MLNWKRDVPARFWRVVLSGYQYLFGPFRSPRIMIEEFGIDDAKSSDDWNFSKIELIPQLSFG